MKYSVAYLLFTVASLIIINATTALATDYYVDVNTGNDRNSGATPDAPWKTLYHALHGMEGTPDMQWVVHVAPGTYSPETGEAFPLNVGSYVTLLGENRDTTIVDAKQTGACIFAVLPYSGALDVTIEGLSVTGGAAPDPWSDWGGGIACCADNAVIRNNKIFGNQNGEMFGGGIYVNAENVLIEDNEIFDNYDDPSAGGGEGYGYDGAIFVDSGSYLIRNNYIHDNECTAINANQPAGPYPTAILQNNLLENNVSPSFDGQDYSLSGTFESVQDCVITGGCYLYAPPGKCPLLYNCIFTGDESVSCYSYSFEAAPSSFVLDFCTFAGGASPQVAVWEAHGRFWNCVFYGSAVPISTDASGYHGAGTAEVHYCRIPDSAWASLPTNFDADPLFVTGPFGDYYLSQTAAGQQQESPCVNAGSTSATLPRISSPTTRISSRTTRTDGAFDAGVVDIGYHYSATPPTIEASVANLTNPSVPAIPHFAQGEILAASVKVENGGLPLWVDVYAGFILPDGSIYCVSPNGLTTDLVPWAAAAHLPSNFNSGDIVVFEAQTPGGLPEGAYTFAAALSLTGGFRAIGNIAFSQFKVQG